MINLLIADDHVSIVDATKLLLENDPEITVIGTAHDGKELLENIKHRNPDIILSDISMPRMNGIEMCKTIKKTHPKIKVIFFSMFEHDDAINDAIKAGASGYLLKRRPLEEIRKAIIEVSRGKSYFDKNIAVEEIYTKADIKPKLSPTERVILKLIAQGKQSSEIADIRHTAVGTIIKHRKNMIQKLGLKGKGELMRYALSVHKHYN